MDIKEITKKVHKVIKGNLELSDGCELAENDTLGKLGADSLDTIEIIMMLEEEFCIEIDDDEVRETITVGQVVDTVKDRLSGDGR